MQIAQGHRCRASLFAARFRREFYFVDFSTTPQLGCLELPATGHRLEAVCRKYCLHKLLQISQFSLKKSK